MRSNDPTTLLPWMMATFDTCGNRPVDQLAVPVGICRPAAANPPQRSDSEPTPPNWPHHHLYGSERRRSLCGCARYRLEDHIPIVLGANPAGTISVIG